MPPPSTPITRRESSRRIRLIALAVVAGLAVMALRAGYLGLVKGGDLSAVAADQQLHTVELPAVRGAILDSAGRELAVDRPTARIEATPYLVTDPVATAEALAPLVRKSVGDLTAVLATRSEYEVLSRQVDAGTAGRIRKLDLPGISVIDTSTRYLPQGRVGAQVLGLVDGEGRGQAGLEVRYEDVLAGTPGRREEARDPFQRTIRALGGTDPVAGQTLQLSIDADIQRRTEAVLAATMRTHRARSATAVVMRPDGAILAMATVPRYNPNDRRSFDPDKARNRPITDSFEPGSVFKVVPVAAALDARLVTPTTRLYVPSTLQVEDLELHDAHEHEPATWSVTEIMERSSNIGTVLVAQRLGRERLQAEMQRWGFGKVTGIDYPGEEDGYLRPLAEWSGTSIANIPIGQGVQVTQLQIARAYAAIANGGTLPTPHLVQRIGDREVTPPEAPRIMTPATARQLDGMLRRAVGPDGTGAAAAIDGYTVAGKTGTANKVDPETGTYTDRYIASFVGYVPAGRPALVIAVSVDEPTVDYTGGGVAAPAFEDIARFSLLTLRIPGD